MNWETLMCLGDSITIGARSYGGYPDYAGNSLEKSLGNNWDVVNHAVSGYTAMDLARSMTTNFSNLKQFAPGIITILIGTNDVKSKTSSEDFAMGYKQILLKAMLLAPYQNVVLIKIPSFPKNISYPYNYAMNEKVERFNEIISELANQNNLRALEFKLSNTDFFDGVHLNAEGSINAGNQLAGFIEREKGVINKSEEVLAVLHAVNG